MAIDAFTGIPGSGKSHGVVERIILPALKAGRTIVHNMPLEESKLLGMAGGGALIKLDADITRERIVSEFPAGAVLVLDEAWRYWPAGLKAANIPEVEREFFAMHRHMVGDDGNSTDIIIVCQDLSQVANFIRDLVEQTFRYNKLTAIGSRTRYRCDVYQGAVTGPKPSPARMTAQQHGKYRAEIYACYQSHTLSKTGAAGAEVKIDKRGTIFSRWTVKAAFAGLIILPILISLAYQAFFALGKPKHKVEPIPAAERSETAGAVSTAVRQQPAELRPPSYSETWRWAGRITVGRQDFYVLESEGGPRYIPISGCTQDEVRNHLCMVDGELVTDWTGPRPGLIQRTIGDAGNIKPAV